jgi:hypothetical protein
VVSIVIVLNVPGKRRVYASHCGHCATFLAMTEGYPPFCPLPPR